MQFQAQRRADTQGFIDFSCFYNTYHKYKNIYIVWMRQDESNTIFWGTDIKMETLI
jgi:hypothetical protein